MRNYFLNVCLYRYNKHILDCKTLEVQYLKILIHFLLSYYWVKHENNVCKGTTLKCPILLHVRCIKCHNLLGNVIILETGNIFHNF